MRICGEYLASLGEQPGRRRVRLAGAIGALVAAHTVTQTDPFDALLRVGERALEVGGEDETRLALSVADTAAAIRERSKGAWRLRGLALEALGRGEEAVGAYERHLDLQQNAEGKQEIALRLGTLRETLGCLEEAARLFPEAGFLGKIEGRSAAQVKAAFGTHVESRLAERGAADGSVRRLVDLYATYRRLTAHGRMADPLLGESEPIGVSAFRNLIAGRTVCLVANAKQLDDSTLGSEIDSYDLVIRFDSFRTTATGTGERTDVHAVTLRGESPWEGPGWRQSVQTRLVFGESVGDWRQALRRRLVAGAQNYVGNPSLRRPVSDPALMDESGWGKSTTTGFNMLRLLDFLDVSPRIDLIGFGLPDQLRPQEKEWVLAHAKDIDATGMKTRTALK
ncbi:glycosyltransferase family 29 protein [Actinacidiphila soli]|uniref:glycosyltransferase family 29 protein n=1 Tax=Actinacidiphila soli TaxID=2487275 RepID=UPI001F0BE0FF|nr:glycosyltransferase family 29 protein [Actinacidiphila soli]